MKIVSKKRRNPVFQVIVCALLATALSADEPVSQSNPYTHLYYRHFVRDADGKTRYELVQHRLPFFDESDTIQAKQRKIISPSAGQILAVQNEYVICRENLFEIAAINIQSGERTELFQHQTIVKLNEHRNELVMMPPIGARVRRYSLTDKKMEILFQGDPSPPIPGRVHNRMVPSPDGQKLALVTHSPKNKDDFLSNRFRVDIVDLTVEETPSILLTNEAYGKIAMTGAGDHVVGPPIVWKDDKSVVLLVSKPPEPLDPKQPSFLQENAITFENTPAQSKLVIFNVNTGKEREICKVETSTELINLQVFDHQLWRRSDGEVMLSANDGSDSRIDFKQKKLVEDSRLSQHYEFRRTKHVGTLLYHGVELAQGVKATEISIAPDGRAVAWLENQQQNRFPNPNAQRSLHYHSLTTGQLKLTTGVFRNEMGLRANHPSTSGTFFWGK